LRKSSNNFNLHSHSINHLNFLQIMKNMYINFLKSKIAPAILFIACSLGIYAQTFTHPGIPLSASDLSTVKSHITAGDYPWKQGYDVFAADGHSSLTYSMQGPFAQVARNYNGTGVDINLSQWRNDMTAAYNLAVMYYMTANGQYATKSRDILLAWANTQTEFSGYESNLDLGEYAHIFGGAASILRGTWTGWTAANTTAVQNLFNNVYWPSTGCAGYALGTGAKAALGLAGAAAIAAFSDDPAKIAKVVYLLQKTPSTGFINSLATGEVGESGRDQGHAADQWASSVMAAEMLYKQGIDLYSYLDNRLLATGEYHARKNLGLGVPFVPFGTTDALYSSDATPVWLGEFTGYHILYGAYGLRKGMNAPNVSKMRLLQSTPDFLYYKTADTNPAATAPAAPGLPTASLVGTGLTNTDIGGALPAGSGTYSNNVWTVSGGGTDIWGHGNIGYHFNYKQITGDCSMIAKVNSVTNTSAGAKAAIMLASDLTSNPTQRAWVAITPSQKVEAFIHGWTEMFGGANFEFTSRTVPQASYWIKLDRIGDMVALYCSPDGTSWACIVQGRIAGFTGSAYIGLAVSSLNNGTACTANFSSVSVTGGTSGVVTTPIAPSALLASGGNTKTTVRWTPSFGASSYNVKRAAYTNGILGTYSDIASGVTGNAYTDTGLSNNQLYSYKVCALNSAGTSPDSPTDSVRPMSQAAITARPSSLAFDELNTTGSFVVSGSDLENSITITAPSGITVSPTSIAAGTQSNVTISVTYNGSTPVNGNIALTCGTTVKNVPVYANTNASCLTPLYSSAVNIIANPYLNSLSTFGGWGAKSINTDPAYAYCGTRSGKITGKCGGSIDYNLTGKIQGNKTYRVRAMVSTNGTGTVKLGIAGATDSVIIQPVSTGTGQWVPVDLIFTTKSTITSASMYFNSCEAQTATVGYIDNWEMYEIPSSTVTTSLSSLSFDELNTTGSFAVFATDLTYGISITAPAGITVSPTSIPAGTVSNVPVTVTYNGTTTPINGNITLTTGSSVKNVAVTAVTNASCFTPLYPTGNKIADPYMNSLTTFAGWGAKSINTDPAYVYCGTRSGKVTGASAGSIDISFPTLKSNTRYRMRAMVLTIGGTFRIGLNNLGSGVANIDRTFNTNGAWQSVDIDFTTGSGATGNLAWFNNFQLTGTTGYIDNWEFYEVPKISHSPVSLSIVGAGAKKVAVTANNLPSTIAITVPAGFTVSPSTLSQTAAGDSLSIIFDGLSTKSGYVYLTCGTVKDSVQVTGTVPMMTTSLSSLTFDDLNTTGSFTVSGTDLANSISIAAPVGITVSPTSIAAGNPTNVAVSVTYDGTTLPLSGSIVLASSGLTKNVAVSSCFTPVYATGNLIPDPKMNSLAGFTQKWGTTSIATGSAAYCGAGSGKVAGTGLCWPNGGSIATPNITWAKNSTCRVRAMVKTVSGSFTIGLTNTYPVGGSTANFILSVSTNNAWKQIDTTFTTGASATIGLAFFNNCEGATGLVGYMDNWEIYNAGALKSASVVTSADISDMDKTVSIFKNENKMITIYCSSLVGRKGIITVYNPVGQALTNRLTSSPTTVINKSFSPGVYIVTINIDGEKTTKKVMID
jgi:hypothetical protein